MLSRYTLLNTLGKSINLKSFQKNRRLLNLQGYLVFVGRAEYVSDPCRKGGEATEVVYKRYIRPCPEDHDHKNMKLKRPMSPHLTIYAPNLSTTTSIIQRINGIILTGYALILAGGALFLPEAIDTYVSFIQSLDLSAASVFIVKIIVGLPFMNHYFNGIRFCIWLTGKALSKSLIYKTAYISIVATGVAVIVFASI